MQGGGNLRGDFLVVADAVIHQHGLGSRIRSEDGFGGGGHHFGFGPGRPHDGSGHNGEQSERGEHQFTAKRLQEDVPDGRLFLRLNLIQHTGIEARRKFERARLNRLDAQGTHQAGGFSEERQALVAIGAFTQVGMKGGAEWLRHQVIFEFILDDGMHVLKLPRPIRISAEIDQDPTE